MATAGKLSRSIHPHPPHRSRAEIAGNPTVCEQYPSSYLPLIVFSANIVTSAVLEPVLHPNKSEPNAADENGSNWKSTASATAKLFLRGVNDSADAFGPLKSVAGGLCFILENCEVWSPSHVRYPERLQMLPANESKWASDRVVGTQSQSPFCLALRIRSSG